MTSRTSIPIQPTSDAYLHLRFYADQLNDVESLRIATENRLRSLLSDEAWGAGVNPDLPEVKVMQAQLDQITAIERGITLGLKRVMRHHPLGPFVKGTVGLGEKQTARLLAATGDPAARSRPSQLWAYCGLHVINVGSQLRIDDHGSLAADRHPAAQSLRDIHSTIGGGVAPRRQRGQKANWNGEAKARAYLVAVSCMKQPSSPYRPIYDNGRAKYADAAHKHPCPRCGPAGKPAAVGTPLSDGHKHARALRLVAKAVLLDLWRAARGSTADAKHVATPIVRTRGGAATVGAVAL